MNENALKTLIQAKLELTNAVIDLLPGVVQEPMRNIQQEFLRSMHSSLKDFLEEPRPQEDTPDTRRGLRRIEVEE